MYSANNQPDSVHGRLFPGYYLPENRAKRVVSLLESKNDWTAEKVQEMGFDGVSTSNTELLKNLLPLIGRSGLSSKQQKLLNDLDAWQGNYELEEVSATVFHRFIFTVLRLTMADELGEAKFKALMNTHL